VFLRAAINCNDVDCTNVEATKVDDNVCDSNNTESASELEEQATSVETSQLHDFMYDSDIDWVMEEVVSLAGDFPDHNGIDCEVECDETRASKITQSHDVSM